MLLFHRHTPDTFSRMSVLFFLIHIPLRIFPYIKWNFCECCFDYLFFAPGLPFFLYHYILHYMPCRRFWTTILCHDMNLSPPNFHCISPMLSYINSVQSLNLPSNVISLYSLESLFLLTGQKSQVPLHRLTVSIST